MRLMLKKRWPGGASTKVSRIGIDFGAGGLRAVQLARAGSIWKPIAFAEARTAAPTPSKTTSHHHDPKDVLSCLQQSSFRRRWVVTCLGPPDIELHPLELPRSSAENREYLAPVASMEIRRLSSLPPEDLETTFWLLPAGKDRAPTALGVATPRRHVLDVMNACRESGLICEVVDVSPWALIRLALTLSPAKSRMIWGILDLGARQSRLIMCVETTPVLVRILGEGGGEWTRRIAENLKIKPQAAEIHKCDYGIVSCPRGVRRNAPTPHSTAEIASILFGALKEPFDKLTREIERSYSYILSCYPSFRIGSLMLAGGGAAMKGLQEFLQGALKIEVKRLSDYLTDPVCQLHVHSPFADSLERFAVAMGLAIDSEP